MRTQSINIYSFDELSESAKGKARQWFRSSDNDFWSESVIEDAAVIADVIGIALRQTLCRRMDKTTFYKPTIYYSGFSSQGDGACFEGTYRYKKGSLKALKSYAPLDTELHRICASLQAEQRKQFYKLTATAKHSGHYYHAYCMRVDVTHFDDDYRDIGDSEKQLTELMRDFANWIYRRLEDEYNYQNSDDVVSENIRANEYEFLENGEIA